MSESQTRKDPAKVMSSVTRSAGRVNSVLLLAFSVERSTHWRIEQTLRDLTARGFQRRKRANVSTMSISRLPSTRAPVPLRRLSLSSELGKERVQPTTSLSIRTRFDSLATRCVSRVILVLLASSWNGHERSDRVARPSSGDRGN